MTEVLIIVLVVGALMLALMAYFFLGFARLWTRAFLSGCPISILDILAMRLRGAPVGLLLDAYIQLRHRGSTASIAEVEKQYLANCGRIHNACDLADIIEQSAAATPSASA